MPNHPRGFQTPAKSLAIISCWFGAGTLLALLRLSLLTTSVYRRSLNYEEGSNYWYVSYTVNFFKGLFTPDFNYYPLILRTASHFLLNVFSLYNEFPIAFKAISYLYYSIGILTLLHPKLDLLSLPSRLFIALYFLFLTGPELQYPFNAGYSMIFVALFLFHHFCRRELKKNDLAYLTLLPLICFSKSTLCFLALPAFALCFNNLRLSKIHKIAWTTISVFFFVSVFSVFYLNTKINLIEVRLLNPQKVMATFLSIGISTFSFLALWLARALENFHPSLVYALAIILVGFGFVSQVKAFQFLRNGLTKNDSEATLMGAMALSAPLAFFAVVNLQQLPWLSQWRGYQFSPINLLNAESGFFFSRHFYYILAVTLLFTVYWIEKSQLSGLRKRVLLFLFFSLQLSSGIYYQQTDQLNLKTNPFLASVYQTIPKLSPNLFCFPLVGFPAANIGHHCHLHSKIALPIELKGHSTISTIVPPENVIAIVLRGPELTPDIPIALAWNDHNLNAITDPSTSYYRYFWIGNHSLTGPLSITNQSPRNLRMEFFYYVADRLE